MTFITSEIKDADILQYGLDRFNKYFGISRLSGKFTVDRERGIYLKIIRFELSEPGAVRYLFGWKGLNMDIKLIATVDKNSSVAIVTTSWGGLNLLGDKSKLDFLETEKQEILKDLKDAVTARNIEMPNGEKQKYTFNF